MSSVILNAVDQLIRDKRGAKNVSQKCKLNNGTIVTLDGTEKREREKEGDREGERGRKRERGREREKERERERGREGGRGMMLLF